LENLTMGDNGLAFDPQTEDIRVERRGRVARVVIDTPAENNRLTPNALAKLELLARDFARDEETQAIVVTGGGAEFFSVGIFNPVLRASYSKDDVIAIVRMANRAYDAFEALPQTVIAALNGVTRAGGAELALACDIRLAAENAVMSFPEAAWGGFPGAGGPARLGALVGRARALEIIGTGRNVDAHELAQLGLVQAVHPAAELAAAAQSLAEKIASMGPLAMRGAKRIMRLGEQHGPAAAHQMADALRYALEWSADVDEAMAAHRENRPPRFTGR
jgi:enoyl-CoA hydratase/carnithine racemase